MSALTLFPRSTFGASTCLQCRFTLALTSQSQFQQQIRTKVLVKVARNRAKSKSKRTPTKAVARTPHEGTGARLKRLKEQLRNDYKASLAAHPELYVGRPRHEAKLDVGEQHEPSTKTKRRVEKRRRQTEARIKRDSRYGRGEIAALRRRLTEDNDNDGVKAPRVSREEAGRLYTERRLRELGAPSLAEQGRQMRDRRSAPETRRLGKLPSIKSLDGRADNSARMRGSSDSAPQAAHKDVKEGSKELENLPYPAHRRLDGIGHTIERRTRSQKPRSSPERSDQASLAQAKAGGRPRSSSDPRDPTRREVEPEQPSDFRYSRHKGSPTIGPRASRSSELFSTMSRDMRTERVGERADPSLQLQARNSRTPRQSPSRDPQDSKFRPQRDSPAPRKTSSSPNMDLPSDRPTRFPRRAPKATPTPPTAPEGSIVPTIHDLMADSFSKKKPMSRSARRGRKPVDHRLSTFDPDDPPGELESDMPIKFPAIARTQLLDGRRAKKISPRLAARKAARKAKFGAAYNSPGEARKDGGLGTPPVMGLNTMRGGWVGEWNAIAKRGDKVKGKSAEVAKEETEEETWERLRDEEAIGKNRAIEFMDQKALSQAAELQPNTQNSETTGKANAETSAVAAPAERWKSGLARRAASIFGDKSGMAAEKRTPLAKKSLREIKRIDGLNRQAKMKRTVGE